MYKTPRVLTASEMTDIMSGGALNSTHSLTRAPLPVGLAIWPGMKNAILPLSSCSSKVRVCFWYWPSQVL